MNTETPETDGAIYRGDVVHARLRPVPHKLHYRVFSLLMNVDRFDDEAKRLRFFSLNRFNIFSLKESQHGFRDGTSVRDFAWAQVARYGLSDQVKRIQMLFYPRMFGFAFNPLTVYFCVDKANRPILMIYEVRNTFGEDLTYVLPAGAPQGRVFHHGIEKAFYVSPFNQVDGDYKFHVLAPEDEVTVGVALRTNGTPLLRTHFRGKRHALTDTSLIKALFAYPLMTLKIVAAIHWEALKLWRKGMRLETKPPAPEARILYGK